VPPCPSIARIEGVGRNQELVPQTTSQCRRFPSPKRLPPTSPALRPFAGAWERNARPPPVLSAWPPRPGFRHVFAALLVARSKGRTDSRRGPSGRVPLVDFCSCVDPRAQPPTLPTCPSNRPKSSAMQCRRLLRVCVSQITPGQGSLQCVSSRAARLRAACTALLPPRRRPRRQHGFTPT
jgi:hypothetical protein